MADPNDPALREWQRLEAQHRRLVDKLHVIAKQQPDAIPVIEGVIDTVLSEQRPEPALIANLRVLAVKEPRVAQSIDELVKFLLNHGPAHGA